MATTIKQLPPCFRLLVSPSAHDLTLFSRQPHWDCSEADQVWRELPLHRTAHLPGLDGDRKNNSTWAKVSLFPQVLIGGHNVVPLKLLSFVVPHAKRGLSFAQLLWLQGVASEELAGTPEAAGFLLGGSSSSRGWLLFGWLFLRHPTVLQNQCVGGGEVTSDGVVDSGARSLS